MLSYKVVHFGLVQTRMNCDCVGIVSLGTQSKLLVQPNTPQAMVFYVRIPCLEGEEVFG
jgi:hypothetical protein